MGESGGGRRYCWLKSIGKQALLRILSLTPLSFQCELSQAPVNITTTQHYSHHADGARHAPVHEQVDDGGPHDGHAQRVVQQLRGHHDLDEREQQGEPVQVHVLQQ